jgi:hypothetical protein
VLLRRGQAAVEAIAAAPDDGSRRVAAAFQQLVVIRELMEAAAGGQWEAVLQVGRAWQAVGSACVRVRARVCARACSPECAWRNGSGSLACVGTPHQTRPRAHTL